MAYALPVDQELLPNLAEGTAAPVIKTEPQPEDSSLALTEFPWDSVAPIFQYDIRRNLSGERDAEGMLTTWNNTDATSRLFPLTIDRVFILELKSGFTASNTSPAGDWLFEG